MEIILIIGVFFLSKLFTRFISFSFFFFSHWREKERKMNCARSLSKRNRSNHSNVFRRLIIIGNEFQRGGRCSFVYSIPELRDVVHSPTAKGHLIVPPSTKSRIQLAIPSPSRHYRGRKPDFSQPLLR